MPLSASDCLCLSLSAYVCLCLYLLQRKSYSEFYSQLHLSCDVFLCCMASVSLSACSSTDPPRLPSNISSFRIIMESKSRTCCAKAVRNPYKCYENVCMSAFVLSNHARIDGCMI